jgi:hypothetical protein
MGHIEDWVQSAVDVGEKVNDVHNDPVKLGRNAKLKNGGK